MTEKWAIVGDAQAPFHDPRAVALASTVIKEFNPDHLIYNGDMTDFWSISKHNPRRHEILQAMSLQDEIDISIQVQENLAAGLRVGSQRHFIDGNHENRLEAFLGVGPQAILGGLKSLQMEKVFALEERGFSTYRPYGEGLWLTDNLFVHHGNFVGTLPGDSVKKEIISIGASVIMNHVHRRADLRFRQGKHEHRGIENGCLCQLASGYAAMTNWAHCLTLVTVKDNRHWTAEVVDIITEDDVVYTTFRDQYIDIPVGYTDGLAQDWKAHKKIDFIKYPVRVNDSGRLRGNGVVFDEVSMVPVGKRQQARDSRGRFI